MSRNPVDHLPLGEIRGLCRKLGVGELAIFGSALGEEFDADSDLDFLVRFRSGAEKPWP